LLCCNSGAGALKQTGPVTLLRLLRSGARAGAAAGSREGSARGSWGSLAPPAAAEGGVSSCHPAPTPSLGHRR